MSEPLISGTEWNGEQNWGHKARLEIGNAIQVTEHKANQSVDCDPHTLQLPSWRSQTSSRTHPRLNFPVRFRKVLGFEEFVKASGTER